VNKMNKNTMMIVSAVLVVLAAVGGFFGGMQYQKGNSVSNLAQGGNGAFRQRSGMMGQNGQNFRPVRGQVLSQSTNTLTVKLSDGSTKIVVLSGSTVYLKSTAASQTDLKTGDTVNVVGTQNSDGSVTAQDVQLNPPTPGR
jgi:hypothetical protein